MLLVLILSLLINNVYVYCTSTGGVLFIRDGANTQYATSTSFLALVYNDLLSRYKQCWKNQLLADLYLIWAYFVRVCISQDIVGQFDKSEESTIWQCKPVELISEAKLLGR